MESDPCPLYKLPIIGPPQVGKNDLVKALIKKISPDHQYIDMKSVIFPYQSTTIMVDGEQCKVQFWGHIPPDIKQLTHASVRGGSGIILVFDVSRSETFETVASYLGAISGFPIKYEVLLFGNKSDLGRAIPLEAIMELCLKHGIAYNEVSAVNDSGLDIPFFDFIRRVKSSRPA